MQLRHIRPRSVEWYDAIEQERAQRSTPLDTLSPEETLRLRTLVALEASAAERAPLLAQPLLRAS
jgi:hypothetical protein